VLLAVVLIGSVLVLVLTSVAMMTYSMLRPFL